MLFNIIFHPLMEIGIDNFRSWSKDDLVITERYWFRNHGDRWYHLTDYNNSDEVKCG